MTGSELFFLLFAVLGGLALFIFGMNVMTEGLRETAGTGLRTILARATHNRTTGLGLGTVLGTLVHSSAATVMLVGFVNAGLMTLEQSVPVMLGANVGTTVSMQAISFKLDAYCFVAIAIGFILHMASPSRKLQHMGMALLGFGLLFLGMRTMSEAIQPHRETLSPILATLDGSTPRGLLLGITVTLLLTAVWQSSGATIGMCYALIAAGVFTDLNQVYPIVLGAHIGTCATAQLGSIGTHIEARRCAMTHLLFNIGNVILAVLAKPLFMGLVALSANDLTRQTANLHTFVMVISALLVLPFTPLLARASRGVLRSKKEAPEPSYLDGELLHYPERAIVACLRELRRISRLCLRSFDLISHIVIFDYDRKMIREVRRNEQVVNEIKRAMKDYLDRMTHHYLSRRQQVMIQHLNRCVIDIERIGDHVDELCDISLRREKNPEAILDEQSLEWLYTLYREARNVLELVTDSLDPGHKKFQETAQRIMEARDAYAEKSMELKASFNDKLSRKEVTPIAGMYFNEYASAFDRIVRHAKTIALAQMRPTFWIKRKKLKQEADDPYPVEIPERIDPKDFLDRLQKEDYL